MARASIILRAKKFQEFLRKSPGRTHIGLRRGLERSGVHYSIPVKRKMTGKVLKRRSGRLVRSVTIKPVEGRGSRQSIRIGTDVEYGSIHEFGGIIRPKSGKYLTIPLDAAKTAAGVARFSARSAPGETFVKRSKAGNLIIFRNEGGGNLTPLFVLKEQVEIPKRAIWGPTLREEQAPIRRIIADETGRKLGARRR